MSERLRVQPRARARIRPCVRAVFAITGLSLALSPFSPLSPLSQPLGAQDSPATSAIVARALDAESAGRNREAITAWRAAIDAGALVPGVLGLERVFSVLAQDESLLVALDTLVPQHPREWQLRSVQLRVLTTIGLDVRAAGAFADWRDVTPTEVAPYREYARVLLYNNRAAAADTVLRQASEALGSTRALVLEIAQMRAGLGLWREAAEAWRDVMTAEPYYESATVWSLTPAPAASRDAVRAVLAARGVPLGATQALALLEVAWNSPRNGWTALAALAPSDTVIAVWRFFADEVERVRAWSTARDAFAAIHAARPDAGVALRGAQAALAAADAVTALALVRSASPMLDDAHRNADALPIELDALARLGRAAEAEALLARAASALGPNGVRAHARTIAWAWIRAGDIPRARRALADAPLSAEDAVAGWLALFDGDLVTARGALRNTEVPGQDAVNALSLLNRTRLERSETIGAAFLALARGDSSQASRRFEAATSELPDVASLLLTLAARIETARHNEERSAALWRRLAGEYAQSGEAPEAHLELARASKRGGDNKGAREHLETLILDYPGSALVPQARRELDALRMGAV